MNDRFLRGRRRFRHKTPRSRRRRLEITEKIGLGTDDDARLAALQAGLVGLHRAIESEEVGVLVEGVGEEIVARLIVESEGRPAFGVLRRGLAGDLLFYRVETEVL